MRFRQHLRDATALLLAALLACPPAHALVSLNDGHDHLYVTGNVSYGWDSNVYANSDSKSDSVVNSGLVAEYTRRAGWIGVNASAAIDAARYGVLKSENFDNPRLSLELTKQTGRTTGSLTLNAARASRADAAVNVRSTSWNYGAGLNFRYPIVSIYTLSGQLGYSLVKYVGASVFPDLATYTASADLIRIFSTDRDIMLGYRYRHAQTSVNASYDDHAANLGLSGKLIRGINGSLRLGYQTRIPHGFTSEGKPESPFNSWTASASTTYAVSKRINLTGTLAKDFSTTASDTSVDSTTGSIDMQYAYSSKWSFGTTLSAGDNKFLGDSGRMVISLGPPPILGPGRRDDFVSATASVSYSMSEHLKCVANYSWFKNWSTSPYADFVRSSYNVNISSRW